MNPEQVKEIVETIKTLNINFNDATTQKIADAIIPVVRMYIYTDIIKTVIWALVVIALPFFLYLGIRSYGKSLENAAKSLERKS